MSKIAPSILAADFARLGDDVRDVCERGIDYLHIDVMDGNFVPNISFGSAVMKSLCGIATVPFDVHLMVSEPVRYVADFMTDDTEFITVHIEACSDVIATIDRIHDLGARAGVSINPETDIAQLGPVLPLADMILVMSVHPGFGGQSFIDGSLDKIVALDTARKANGYKYMIEVDGGIGPDNANKVRDAGADIIVAGSAVFGAADRTAAINDIKG